MNEKPQKSKLKTAVAALAVIAAALVLVPLAIPTKVGVLTASVGGDETRTVDTWCFRLDGLLYNMAGEIAEGDIVQVKEDRKSVV